MNNIPEMTHPLSKGHEQPATWNMLLDKDDQFVRMTRSVWNRLLEYNSSIPTGVYEGKMWRCYDWLCWFGPSEHPDKCALHRRKIILCEGVKQREDGVVCVIESAHFNQPFVTTRCGVQQVALEGICDEAVTCLECMARK